VVATGADHRLELSQAAMSRSSNSAASHLAAAMNSILRRKMPIFKKTHHPASIF
jgi:hypothetical protein